MNIQRNRKEIEQYAGMPDAQGVHGGQTHGVHNGAAQDAAGAVHKAGSRGFCVDFSGGLPGDHAYEKQGKTMEDVMAEAAATDVSLQKDYMTVMSNSMSDEDFAKLSEEGYNPGVMEPEEAVTIVDTIKAEMAESGQVVAGYNDDIDFETLKKITGSEVRAQEILDAFYQHDIPVTEKNVQDAQSAMEMARQVADQIQNGTKEDLEGIRKYLLENHLSPVLENLYRAAYSGSHDADMQGRGYFAETTGGYYGRKADELDVAALQDSMEKVIREAGYEVTEETLREAAWMVETGLALTSESFAEYKDVDQAVDGIIRDGRTAKALDFFAGEPLQEKAARLKKEAAAITDAAVDKVIADGDRLDLAHLTKAQEKIQNDALQNDVLQNDASEQAEVSEDSISARRQMEEVRLYMSVQVNYHLLKQGISIDTTELSALVENLKAAEQEIQRVLFGGGKDGNGVGENTMNTGSAALLTEREMSALFQETVGKVRAIPGMPASILGELLRENGSAFSGNVTVDMVYETGLARQNAYAAMEEHYEPLMTSPMAEYGDSIEKAFRNVDGILQEMNLETTEGNRRAVRILGYNGMEISEENIHAVKETYMTVSRVIEKMTPAATLDLIREGVNPLAVSMEELENHLAGRDDDAQGEMEKYSRYLYRLEQKNEITPEEKESYIGIYRLLHQIEKRDGAAIGSLLQQGAEINFKNLLTAVRNHNRGRMDYQVDDSFGALKDEIVKENGYHNSITAAVETAYGKEETAQYAEETVGDGSSDSRDMGNRDENGRIAYYQNLAGDVKAELMPEEVSELFDTDDISLEAFYDRQQELLKMQTQEAEKADYAYVKEQAAEIRKAAGVSDQAVSMLLSFDIPATIDNLMAADGLLSDRGGMAGQVKKQAAYLDERRMASAAAFDGADAAAAVSDSAFPATDEVGRKESLPDAAKSVSSMLDDAIGSLQEHFTDGPDAKEAYEHLADQMEKILTVSAEQQTDRIDVKEIRLAWKQLSVARNLAREECYEVPMEIGGRMTSVNVHFRHSAAAKEHVTITMETENFGKVSALFGGDEKPGYIVCDRADSLAILKERENAFQEELRAMELPAPEIKFIQSDRIDINNFAGNADEINRTGMSSEKLYQTAKTFMKVFLENFA